MKIIVEGCDGAGKTTLINKIRDKLSDLNFKIIHCTRDTPNNLKFFGELLDSKDNLIIDRMYMGQFIYQTEEERKKNRWLNKYSLLTLENYITERQIFGDKIFCIYVDALDETCLFNCKLDSDDSHYTIEYIRELKSRYEDFINNVSNIEWITYYNDYDPTGSMNCSNDSANSFDWSSLPKIKAVDFDGTLVKNDFPFIHPESLNKILIDDLIKFRKDNGRLILWTNRSGSNLIEAVEFCRSVGLEFDAINDNVKEVKDAGFNPRKPYYDELIDDRNSCLWTYDMLYGATNK